jgi:hypothetical protein
MQLSVPSVLERRKIILLQKKKAGMKFLYPLPPNSIVTQTFAEHERRRELNGWTNYNGGIDWACPTGTPIKASQDGVVTVVRSDATGYGTHVRIEHTEGNTKYTTIYGHLKDIGVGMGDRVSAGEVIGTSDNTGFSSGPHLHFELRKGIQAIDPAPLLVKTLAELRGEDVQPDAVIRTTASGVEPQQFPVLPRVRVLVATLNIRLAPGVENRITGSLSMDNEVEVFRKINMGNDVWLQIGYEQYIAMQYDGNTLAGWV